MRRPLPVRSLQKTSKAKAIAYRAIPAADGYPIRSDLDCALQIEGARTFQLNAIARQTANDLAAAMDCNTTSSRKRSMGITAAGLPAKRREVKAST